MKKAARESDKGRFREFVGDLLLKGVNFPPFFKIYIVDIFVLD